MRTLILILAASVASTSAQLAITEVMSSAANTFGGNPVTQASDFFEVTNFGADAIPLTGYKWTDDSSWDPLLADPTPFEGVVIQPGESVIVLYTNVTPDQAAFRAWWGANAASVRVLPHNHRGFSSNGDSVRLWDPLNFLVDAVDFPAAVRGRTFVYDPQTGVFGRLSTNGVDGAYTAATADDNGSPGLTTGSVPITVVTPPTNVTVSAGSPAQFSVVARGLPRVRYQWLHNSNPLAGATTATLNLTNVQSGDAGTYTVRLTNGLEVVTRAATLTVNPAPVAPTVTVLPQDQTLYLNQHATFSVAAIGNPAPQYEWRFNGQVLLGETSPDLTRYYVSQADAGTYTVRVYNSAGSTNVSAILTVTPRPKLVITELMSSEGTNAAGVIVGADWWELSNLDTFAVNLKGYAWDDDESRGGAFVITNDVVLRPGDCAVLVEGLTPGQFRAWWGPEHLPPALAIIRYTGNGLSSLGDVISLWNPGAVDDFDRIVNVAFGAATPGVSFGFNPVTESFGALSVAGQFGAFSAPGTTDVGSPGYRWNRPVITSALRVPGGLEITWSSRASALYAVSIADALAGPWSTLTNRVATGASTTIRDTTAPPAGARFYRVVENP